MLKICALQRRYLAVMSYQTPAASLQGLRRRMASWSLSNPPRLPALESSEANKQARTWLAQFRAESIPRDLVEMSFSRSSGPGGQNVNKVNTKATIRCSLNAAWIPLWAHEALRKSPHYVPSSQSLLITSSTSRSQAQNLQDCLSKLHKLVLNASSSALINEPSEAQKEKVRQLAHAEKSRRRAEKERKSATKRSRSTRAGDWD